MIRELKHRVRDHIRFVQGPHGQPLPGGLFADRNHIHVFELLVLGVIQTKFATKPIDIRLAPRQELPSLLDEKLLRISL